MDTKWSILYLKMVKFAIMKIMSFFAPIKIATKMYKK